MPILGSNLRDAMSLIDWLGKGLLLPPGAKAPHGLEVEQVNHVHDIDELLLQAGDRTRDGKCLVDVKDYERSRFYGDVCRAERLEVLRHLDEVRSRMASLVESQVVGRFGVAITEVIQGDFVDLFMMRCAFGKKHLFSERVFRLYECGGMPVSWAGSYPSGRLVVFFAPAG